MRKTFIFLFALFLLFVLSACSNNEEEKDTLSDDEIKELVNDYTVRNIEGHTASITSEELIIVDEDENEIVYDLPEDEFFVSIAPFFQETHPCKDHSLTGCQGELVNQDFDIKIVNEDGETLIDEKITSEENGFIDLWLPRDQTFDISIESEGKNIESEISTFKDDGTCITTLQLT